jgi:predicted dehydrogenase
MNKPVHVGLIGSQFISSIHAESLQRCPGAVMAGVASPTPGNAAAFAKRFGIPQAFTDYRELLALPDLDMVVIGVPNDRHCEVVVEAARAGKHIVIEKPLCLNLAEADRMIAAAREAGVKLMYAEELCFAPKYVRLKQLLDSGALGVPTPAQAVREARRPARGAFLGRRTFRRRRHHGHGLPRHRVLPLAPRPPAHQVGLCADGHARPRGQDPRRGQRPCSSSSSRTA